MTAALVLLFVVEAIAVAYGLWLAFDIRRIQSRIAAYDARRESGFGRAPAGQTLERQPLGRSLYDHPTGARSPDAS